MPTASNDIYHRLARQIAGKPPTELNLQFRRRAQDGTLFIISDRETGDFHAQLTKDASGALTYTQRGLRKTPGTQSRWTRNTAGNQPLLTIVNIAQESLDMYIEAVEHALPSKFAADARDLKRTVALAIERAANSRSGKTPPRTRDLKRRLQDNIDASYANDAAALQLLQKVLGNTVPRESWTINQYNAAVLHPELLLRAHRETPHICQSFLTHTVNLTETHNMPVPADLEQMAAATGWNRITGTVRTTPPTKDGAKIRNAAAAIRDAQVHEPCSLAAKSIWSETDLHWELRQIDERDSETWSNWTRLIAAALSNHPEEPQVHRRDQCLFTQTMTRGSPHQRAQLTGPVSCLAQASIALHLGRLLLAARTQEKPWPQLSWEQYESIALTGRHIAPPRHRNTPPPPPAAAPQQWPTRISRVNILGFDIKPVASPGELPDDLRTPDTIEDCAQNRARYFLAHNSEATHVATIELTRSNTTWKPGRTTTPPNTPEEPGMDQVARILASQYQYSQTDTRLR